MAQTWALSGIARSGATRSGWPIAVGVVMPLYALSGVARSGATRSGYVAPIACVSVAGVQRGVGRSVTDAGVRDLTIEDILNSTPNTAQFTALGFVPVVGSDVVVTLGSINNLWRTFGGQVVSVEQSDLKTLDHRQAYTVHAIDYTWGLDKRKVTGHFTGSATTIAQTLVSTYASGYTYLNIEAGMPTVSGGITFTNQDLSACLTALMKRVGGSWYCDYSKDVHCFLNDTFATGPTTINAVHSSLRDFRVIRDLSQVATRVYVEGGGSQAFSAVAVGETILPVTDANWYNAAGGTVVSGPQRITYTGRSLGGGGGLVGPGAAPSAAPVVALASGAGIENGAHGYGVTFVTAAGESIVSPLATITTGVVAAPVAAPTCAAPTIGTGPNPGSHDYAVTFVTASGETTPGPSATKATTLTAAPTTAPTAGTPTTGAGVDDGNHDYAVTFVTSIGETTPSPISGQVTTSSTDAYDVPAPSSASGAAIVYAMGAGWAAGDLVYYVVTYLISGGGETTAGPVSNTLTGQVYPDAPFYVKAHNITDIPVSSDPNVTSKRIYRNVNGAWTKYRTLAIDATSTSDAFTFADTGAPPDANTAHIAATSHQQVPLSAIPVGDANVTSRKLYRRSAGAGLKLVDTGASLSDNTTTTYNDVAANAALGAAAPTINTAYIQRIALSAIPTGGALVTERNVWRTEAGGAQLKLLVNLPNNTTTTYDDIKTDAELGGNVPVENTATANQVTISGVPIGAAAVTQRKIYRTVAGGSQLKLQQTIANNTDVVGVTDATADAALGSNVPTSDTSGLAQPSGQVVAGSTALITAGLGAFSSSGGWAVIGNGEQVIRYTGKSATALTGIPASGVGAIVASVGYNSSVTTAPCLTGIPASGAGSILYTILRGDDVNLWATVNDTAAQAALAALIGGDGIQEYYIQDRRLSYDEAVARGTAWLTLHSASEVGIHYTSRDINTRAGRIVTVNLGSPVSVTDDYLIQRVTISDFGRSVMPLFTVEASSTRFSFEELLRLVKENR